MYQQRRPLLEGCQLRFEDPGLSSELMNGSSPSPILRPEVMWEMNTRHDTDELLAHILNDGTRLSDIMFEDGFEETSLESLLATLLTAKHMRKSDCIRRSGLNETFAYQIFSGDRHPSRDKVLQLVFALDCDLSQAQKMLRCAGVNELYCRNRRDAIIVFCLSRGYTLQRTDGELYRFGEPTITDGDNERGRNGHDTAGTDRGIGH